MRVRRRRLTPAASAYQRAPASSAKTPWRAARYAVVDLEMTGLDPRRDEIVSFASIPIDAGRVVVREVRAGLIRPSRMPTSETIRIHGLRPADLADAPRLEEALDAILEALTGRILVAHAAWVEQGFLTAALRPSRLRLRQPTLDTAVLARHVLPPTELPNEGALTLSTAAHQLGLPVHRPHTAEGDALTTAQVFLALATRLDQADCQTVGSLARLSREAAVAN